MFPQTNRRSFLHHVAKTGLLATAGEYAFLNSLPALSAQEVQAARNMARVAGDIEPLVRLIEDTPQNRLVELVAERVRGGTSYQQLLSAVMLAGVRGIQPRPVGFKFHAVLVVNSAHQASLAAQNRDRWLPLFWACDNFKRSQARNRAEGDWRLAPVDDARLPAAAHAGPRFREAMDNWDTEGADRAIAAWARTAGANEVYEALWRYGARDFRDIGHKAIFVANSYRTLQTIGWRHAEPILRSLAYALLDHEGTNPAQRDADQDRPGRENVRRAARIRADWQRGRVDRQATIEALAMMRTANPPEACEGVVAKLNAGVDPASVWDAIFLTCGELLMRQPGIVGLHTITTMNALYFAYQTSSIDETRRMMLLQAAAFVPMFRRAMEGRGRLRDDVRIDALEPLQPTATGAQAVDEIFADVSNDKMTASRKTLALLRADQDSAQPLLAAARRLVFSKGNDSHDYKFSSAALEDFHHVTPGWRDHFLASSVFWLKGSGGADTELAQRIRAALS